MPTGDPALSAHGALYPDRVSNDMEIGRTALRKATVRLLPLLAFGYGAAYVDRVNVGFAALQMNRDLHFSASIFGLGAGLFFASYVACEVPSNLLLIRFGGRRWLARIMLTWGILAMAMMLVRTPRQFYLLRFLLGMAEAGFFPGVIFYLTQWFPAEMRARTVSRFYVALPLSVVFMGGIAGALLNLQGRLSLAGWQWLFLLEGIPAVILSVIFFSYLPDRPADAKWLSVEERNWLMNQLRAEDPSAGGNHTDALTHAFLDSRVWQLGIFLFCTYASTYALIFSAPVMLQEITGATATKVGFGIAAMHLLGALGLVLNARHSDLTRERHLHTLIPCVLMAIGFAVGGVSTAPTLVLTAFAIIFVSFFATMGPVWAMPSSFLTGKSAAAGMAAINAIGSIGGFLGPYFLGRARDSAGNYQSGLLTLAMPPLIAAAVMFAMLKKAIRVSDKRV